MKNILKILIPLAFLSTLSCKKQGKDIGNLFLSNVGYKNIVLDSFTSNSNVNFRLTKIKNNEYLSFFNRNNFSIYIYGYKSGKLIKKIKLGENSLNKITTPYYALDYYIYTLDSIFVSTIKNYYLLNSDGKILKKLTPIIKNKYVKIKRPVFNEATNYKNGLLSFEIETDFPDKNEKTYLWRSYDFNKNIVTGNYINKSILVSNYNDVLNFKLLNLKKRGTYDKIAIQFVKENNKLFASTAINDSVYVFDSNKKLINIFYAGDKNIKIPGFIEYFKRKKITRMGIATAIEDKLEQPPFFTNMFIDKENGFIYRILIHGAKAIFNSNSTVLTEKKLSVLKGATLVAINIDSKKLYTFELPINEIQIPLDNSKIFLTNTGLHFPLIRQEKENIIRYKILKIKNKKHEN